MNEALVHNGDFANYYSVTEHLKQRNVYPLFLTDTEVSVQVFDLLNRVYGYPLEYIIEALAPTGEMDFEHLPEEKKLIYRQIQATHIHGSPDGPWFFIIARTMAAERKFQLIGITDTAMLRPQVFALHDGDFQVGLICSEKQAIDATLRSLASVDPRFGTVADRYWNARGGSYTDGGSFIFTLSEAEVGYKMVCTDKFGREIAIPGDRVPYDFGAAQTPIELDSASRTSLKERLSSQDADGCTGSSAKTSPPGTTNGYDPPSKSSKRSLRRLLLKGAVIELLTRLIDRRFPTGAKRRRSILQMASDSLDRVFRAVPLMTGKKGGEYVRIDHEIAKGLAGPEEGREGLRGGCDRLSRRGRGLVRQADL